MKHYWKTIVVILIISLLLPMTAAAADGVGTLFQDIPEDSYVYFVHSYYLEAEDPGIVTAVTEYGAEIHASVEKGNLFACQFHPEKSSRTGLQILKNFTEL